MPRSMILFRNLVAFVNLVIGFPISIDLIFLHPGSWGGQGKYILVCLLAAAIVFSFIGGKRLCGDHPAWRNPVFISGLLWITFALAGTWLIVIPDYLIPLALLANANLFLVGYSLRQERSVQSVSDRPHRLTLRFSPRKLLGSFAVGITIILLALLLYPDGIERTSPDGWFTARLESRALQNRLIITDRTTRSSHIIWPENLELDQSYVEIRDVVWHPNSRQLLAIRRETASGGDWHVKGFHVRSSAHGQEIDLDDNWMREAFEDAKRRKCLELDVAEAGITVEGIKRY